MRCGTTPRGVRQAYTYRPGGSHPRLPSPTWHPVAEEWRWYVAWLDEREVTVPALRAEGLFKVFGRRADEAVRRLKEGATREDVQKLGATPAVIDATFDVEPGEIFVVMGLSGSGKSTL